ncbi:STE3-domain-containing protein [Peniophora sp. CONT]|nr:STE3-domain-containing protein [Peniophora sp. CONT]
MVAVDPSYPFYPVAAASAAAMVLLVLLTSFARQSWNLGITILCFWLFWENATSAVNAIVWSDNAEDHLEVYCNIVTRVQVIASVVKPMTTFIISRRLDLIASLKPVELYSKAAVRDTYLWSKPRIQTAPYQVLEGFGCQNVFSYSILAFILIFGWNVLFPILSVIFFYPRVVWTFYCQHRELNQFLNSNNSVSRANYFRILALASIDILLTLPFGITNLVLGSLRGPTQHSLPFYPGWTAVHSNWKVTVYSYATLEASGTATVVNAYFSLRKPPVLAFVVFGLFGLTSEARASYCDVIYFAGCCLGCKARMPRKRSARSALERIVFAPRRQDSEMGCVLFMPSACASPCLTSMTRSSPSSGVSEHLEGNRGERI